MTKYSKIFKPSATRDLVRLGGEYDGGYVLPERMFKNSHGLVTLGLSDEFQFERDFSRRTGMPVTCFDHTVNFKFWIRRFSSCVLKGVFGFNSVKGCDLKMVSNS